MEAISARVCFFFVAVDRLATGLRRVTVLRTAGRRRDTTARAAGRLVAVVLRLGAAFLTKAVDLRTGLLAATRRTVGRLRVIAVDRRIGRRATVLFFTRPVLLRFGLRTAVVLLIAVFLLGAALRAAGR